MLTYVKFTPVPGTCPSSTCVSDGGGAFATTTCSSSSSSVAGFLTYYAFYDTTDTSCKNSPYTLQYYALGACVPGGQKSAIYTADSSGNVGLFSFSDAACSTWTGVYTKLTSQICVGGASQYVYSKQAPDANINSKAAGSTIVLSLGYTAGDTSCSGAPTAATYTTAQSCVVSGSSSYQYVADGSGNTYKRTFSSTTTCASGKDTVTVMKMTQIVCAKSTNANSGPSTSYPSGYLSEKAPAGATSTTV